MMMMIIILFIYCAHHGGCGTGGCSGDGGGDVKSGVAIFGDGAQRTREALPQ